MGSWLSYAWQLNTVRIVNEWDEVGTGFLVKTVYDEAGSSDDFLITNRHVIENEGKFADLITIDLYVQGEKDIETVEYPVHLKPNGIPIFKCLADAWIDITAIKLSDLAAEVPNKAVKFLDTVRLSNKRLVRERDISWGDEVVTLGYPLGMSVGEAKSPILRPAIISSDPLKEIDFVDPDWGELKNQDAFFIGAEILDGQSGSIVILKPVVGRRVDGQSDMNPAEPALLGIVSHGFDELPVGIVWNGNAVVRTLLEHYPGMSHGDLNRYYLAQLGYQAPLGLDQEL